MTFGKNYDGRAVQRGSGPGRAPTSRETTATKPSGEPRGCTGQRNADRRRGPREKAGLRERRGACEGFLGLQCPVPARSRRKTPSATGAARSEIGSEGSRRTRLVEWDTNSPFPRCRHFAPGVRHPPDPPRTGGRGPPSSPAPPAREGISTG